SVHAWSAAVASLPPFCSRRGNSKLRSPRRPSAAESPPSMFMRQNFYLSPLRPRKASESMCRVAGREAYQFIQADAASRRGLIQAFTIGAATALALGERFTAGGLWGGISCDAIGGPWVLGVIGEPRPGNASKGEAA